MLLFGSGIVVLPSGVGVNIANDSSVGVVIEGA